MVEKREILIQLRKGYPIRKINRDLGVHRSIIRSVYKTACDHGWMNVASSMPENAEIEETLGCKPAKLASKLDPYVEKIKEWCKEGISAIVIQRFLKEQFQCSCEISTLRRYIRKSCPNLPEPVMVRATKPGEVLDVDFGYLGKLWDQSQGKSRKAWVFSGRLRHSRRAYRRVVWNQSVSTFLDSHIFAFEHFNGVPEILCLDNLKAGVIKSSIDNNMLNRSYKELAEHYDCMISPCLPRTPEHKGGVENDIKYIKGNFWPQIIEKQKTSSKLTLEEVQSDLDVWDREVANIRKIRTMGRSPEEIFATEEKEALKKLPNKRYEKTEWFQCIVRKEWWVIFESSY